MAWGTKLVNVLGQSLKGITDPGDQATGMDAVLAARPQAENKGFWNILSNVGRQESQARLSADKMRTDEEDRQVKNDYTKAQTGATKSLGAYRESQTAYMLARPDIEKTKNEIASAKNLGELAAREKDYQLKAQQLTSNIAKARAEINHMTNLDMVADRNLQIKEMELDLEKLNSTARNALAERKQTLDEEIRRGLLQNDTTRAGNDTTRATNDTTRTGNDTIRADAYGGYTDAMREKTMGDIENTKALDPLKRMQMLAGASQGVEKVMPGVGQQMLKDYGAAPQPTIMDQIKGKITGKTPPPAAAPNMGGNVAVSLKPPAPGTQLTDKKIVDAYLKQAGGDANKARQLAKADGWVF